MSVNTEQNMTDLEHRLNLIQKVFRSVQNVLEGVPEQKFNLENYCSLHLQIFNLCTRYKESYQMYEGYKESFNAYINTMVLPALRGKHDEPLVKEFVKRWRNHKIMVQRLSNLFNYLDRYYIPRFKLPSLQEVGLMSFSDQVYAETKSSLKEAIINLIYQEREGGNFDGTVLKKAVEVFEEMGFGSIEVYERDFELAMLADSATYYSKKAASWIEKNSFPAYMHQAKECLQREKERAVQYLHVTSESKLLERVQHEVFSQFKNLLLKTGVHLKLGTVEDLSEIYRNFDTIPKGLEPIAAMFKKQLIGEGTQLFEQFEDTAGNEKPEEKGTYTWMPRKDVISIVLVRKLTELHDKYLPYVKEFFSNRYLFLKRLNEGLESICNKGVGGSTWEELLVTFCDELLKKDGSERLSREATKDAIDKVARIVSYIRDKDLFAEFYRKKLASRLLFTKSSNDDHECYILTKLKQQFGGGIYI